ncbi:FtsK/SpoIIIE domain-containing protein [Streptomyces sp. NBC_01278]|uniref:cell division protein FtsK n=1 Tax=unclassified Streptomyces TaxID=2593676 RepID=UPI002E32ABF1|nr:cell division protein FtsK [Streptomyces sp. NBC_01278]
MNVEQVFDWAPVVLVACAALLVVWAGAKTVRYIRADKETRQSIRQAVRIRMTWTRLAKMAGLSVIDRTPPWLSFLTTTKGAPEPKPRELVPMIKARPDRFGVVVNVKLLPKVGIKELQDKARFLADAWGCVRVAVEAGKPGHAVLRAIRTDPLTGHTEYVPTGQAPTDLTVWPVGRDEYGALVHIELKNKSGAVVAGGVGGGKSNKLTSLITYFGPSPAVQFALLDGKVSDAAHGDYADVLPRVFAHAGNDLREANKLLRRLVKLLHDRATMARSVLGTANMWNVGPSAQWPLVIAIIDESHTFFHDHKGSDKETRELAALAAENIRLVGLLVKGGRSVGIFTVPATQKATGDAIPTSIRDVCSAALSFYQRTTEASVAALGDDIRNWPDMDPINLQGSQYVGVASMAAEGRPGFVRVRTPYLEPADAAAVAQSTAHLTQDPTALLAKLTPRSLRKPEPPQDDAPAAA